MDEQKNEQVVEEILKIVRDLSAKVDRLETRVNELSNENEKMHPQNPQIQPKMNPAYQKMPMGQPMNQPMGQPMGRPMNQPMGQPMGRPMNQPMGQPMGRPMNRPMGQPMYQSAGRPVERTTEKTNKRTQKPEMEQILGKYAMPIIATILILSGIGVFAYSSWESLGNIIKAVMVLILAGGIAGIGALFGRKEKMYSFKLTAFAIGLSILFMDIAASTLVWHLFDNLIAFVLVLVWGVICVLIGEKYQEGVFFYVSFTGIAIEFIWVAAGKNFGISEFIFLVLISVTFAGVVYFFQKHFKKYCWIPVVVVTVLVFVQGIRILSLTKDAAYLMLMRLAFTGIVAAFAVLGPIVLKQEDSQTIGLAGKIAYCVFAFFGPLSVVLALKNAEVYWMVLVLLLAVIYCLNGKTRMWAMPSVGISTLIVLCLLNSHCLGTALGGAVVFALGFVLAYAFKRNVFYRCYAFCAATVAVIIGYEYYLYDFGRKFVNLHTNLTVVHVLEYVGLAIVYLILMGLLCNKESRGFQAATLPIMVTVLEILGSVVREKVLHPEVVTALVVTAIFALFAGYVFFFLRKFEVVITEAYIYAVLFEWYFLLRYLGESHVVTQIVLGGLLLLVFTLIAYAIRMNRETNSGIMVIFLSFLLVNYFAILSKTILFKYAMIVSFGMVVIACIFILMGFVKKMKSVRLYGLVLILLSVCKMLLLDIGTKNVTIRVACFTVAGLICLGISYIYNRLEKNMNLK